jgi:hypothetical protein
MSNGGAGLGSVTGFLQIGDGPGSATGAEVEVGVSQWWTSGDSGVVIDTPAASIGMTEDQAAGLARLLIKAAVGYDGKDSPQVGGAPLAEFLAGIQRDLRS